MYVCISPAAIVLWNSVCIIYIEYMYVCTYDTCMPRRLTDCIVLHEVHNIRRECDGEVDAAGILSHRICGAVQCDGHSEAAHSVVLNHNLGQVHRRRPHGPVHHTYIYTYISKITPSMHTHIHI
jgi:hypothetical protein